MTDPNRALQPRPNAQPTLPPEPAAIALPPGMSLDDIPLSVKNTAVRIVLQKLAQGEVISAAAALAAAGHFDTTGEVLGRHAYVGSGKLLGQIVEGYRGVTRKLDMSQYQWFYRAPNDDEKTIHNIRVGKDRMVVCELTVFKALRQAKELGVAYHPILGYSIAREGDKLNSPAYRDSRWIMEKQSLVDALRKCGENTTAEEVLDDAEAQGIDVANMRDAQDAGGWLDREQAETAVAHNAERQALANATPEVRAAYNEAQQAELAVLDMQRQFGTWTYDCLVSDQDAPCPMCGNAFSIKAHTADCAFRLIKPDLPHAPVIAPEAPSAPVPLTGIAKLHQQLRDIADPITTPATPKQIDWNAKTLALLSNDPAETEAFMEWAFGPFEGLTGGQALAVYRWSSAEKQGVGGDLRLGNPKAQAEFDAVIAALRAA